jgi:hypothetical protein
LWQVQRVDKDDLLVLLRQVEDMAVSTANEGSKRKLPLKKVH